MMNDMVGMNGNLQSMGMEFVAAIKHTTSSNDTSRKFANLDMQTIKPINSSTAVALTPQVFAPTQAGAPLSVAASPVRAGIGIRR